MSTQYDELGQIMAYEAGELDDAAEIELFQHLVDNGMAWQLQGHYGRTATAMILAGVVHRPAELTSANAQPCTSEHPDMPGLTCNLAAEHDCDHYALGYSWPRTERQPS